VKRPAEIITTPATALGGGDDEVDQRRMLDLVIRLLWRNS
jgi:hypothetical protein